MSEEVQQNEAEEFKVGAMRKDLSRSKDNEESDEIDEENWYELRVDSKQPERRANHSSFIVGSKMFIYGGYDMREGPMQSVWSFDLKNVGELHNSDLSDRLPLMTW